MTKILCNTCNRIGYLQQLTPNYFRIRHYESLDPITHKPKFTYHQISKSYAESQITLKAPKPDQRGSIDPNNIGQLRSIGPKLNDNNSDHKFQSMGPLENLCFSLPRTVSHARLKY
jgi:hypothetical protein